MTEPVRFTVREISTAIGVRRQTVAAYLSQAISDGRKLVRGQLASSWRVVNLPQTLRGRLEKEAKAKGFRFPEDMLKAVREEWTPAVPMGSLDKSCITAAEKLLRALRPSLLRRNGTALSAEEFERLGRQDYKAEFGHGITSRHFRRLLDRTVRRDRGAENWERLEIYLPDALKARSEGTAPFCNATEAEFRELHDLLTRFKVPEDPSAEEEAVLWTRTFELLEHMAADGHPAKKTRRRMLRFLWRHASWLAASFNALRVAFDYKRLRWEDGGRTVKSVLDGRAQRRGTKLATPYDEASLEKITWHAVANCGGRVSQAVRELIEQDELDPEIVRAFTVPRANKSSIPHRLRESVQYDVDALLPVHQGPRAVDKLVPSLDLTYDGIRSMQCVQADDFTMPVYFYVPDGEGWYRLTRGQVLLAIDWRSLFILGFCLYPEGQYHSGLIRTLFTRIFSEWGLPEVLYLERGIWKSSKLVTGGAAARKDVPFSDAEMECGLGQYGIRFMHARRARSKPVERVGGMVQDLMEGEPGYCGRDERRDCPEITTEQKRLVEARKKTPQELGLYSVEQWEARLAEIFSRYSAARQNGKRLRDISPHDAFVRFWDHEDPPTKFGPEHRFLLAHHKLPVTVKPSGEILFEMQGERFRYFDEQTGAHKGESLTAWFNPEAPEICTFTDRSMRNPFSVERHTPVNGLYPDETYKAETAKAQSAMKYSKARYRVLKANFEGAFRSTIAAPATAELGRHIAQESAGVIRRRARATTIQTKARRLGLPAEVVKDDDRTLSALELIEAARRENQCASHQEQGGFEI